MKIKGPTIPPPTTPQAKGKMGEVKKQTGKIANTLASLVGGQEEVKKKERKKATAQLSEAEKRKRLKGLGAKCGITPEDSTQEATKKIVEGVLSDEYDRDEIGFSKMVQDISGVIRKDEELEKLFDRSIKIMQSV